jgi:hydroxyacylglutathione hydrolase
MAQEITTIVSHYSIVSANCYLVRNAAGCFLVDSGIAKTRAGLVKDLEAAGCRPGDLRLILLTHGDLDHTGNAAFLHLKYGAKIAMHRDDLVNVETGDMFANKNANPFAKSIARAMFFVMGLSVFDTFTPDVFLEDEQDLSVFGINATAIHLPGHSKGSMAYLTDVGDLFCGDQFENTKKPAPNSLADDAVLLSASAARLKSYPIKTVYPGHGYPFPWEQLLKII